MPRIRLILEDDNGNPLPEATEQIYQLDGNCDTLNQIEAAVETFKNQALLGSFVPGELTVRQWCEQQGVTDHQYLLAAASCGGYKRNASSRGSFLAPHDGAILAGR